MDIEQFIREGQDFLSELKNDRKEFSKELPQSEFYDKLIPNKKIKKINKSQNEEVEEDSFEEHEQEVFKQLRKFKKSNEKHSLNWQLESEVVSCKKSKEDQQRQMVHKILEKYNTMDKLGPETIPEEESMTDVSLASPLNSSQKLDHSAMKPKLQTLENNSDLPIESPFSKFRNSGQIRHQIFPEKKIQEIINDRIKKENKFKKEHTFGDGKMSQLEDVDVSLSESEDEDCTEFGREDIKNEEIKKNQNNFITFVQQKINNLKHKFKSLDKNENNEDNEASINFENLIIKKKPEIPIKKASEKNISKKSNKENTNLSSLEKEKEEKRKLQRELYKKRMNYKPMLSRKKKNNNFR